MHDAYRVDKGGKPTFDRVIRGLDELKRHEVEWNALTTIHAANGDHGRQVYTFLRDELGPRSSSTSRSSSGRPSRPCPLANEGWGHGMKGRPLYTQDGDLVTTGRPAQSSTAGS